MGSALRQQSQFHEVVGTTRGGPVRDRLASIGGRVDEVIVDVWEVARRGDTLHDGLRRLDVRALERDLADSERELAAAGPERRTLLAEMVATRRASLASAQRLAAGAQLALDRLRALDADLARLVVNAVEVSATASSAADLDDIDRQFDVMVDELEGLRRALEETESVQRDSVGGMPPVHHDSSPAGPPVPDARSQGGTPMPG